MRLHETRSLQFWERQPSHSVPMPIGVVPGDDGKETLIVFAIDLAISIDANVHVLQEAQAQILAAGGRLLKPAQSAQPSATGHHRKRRRGRR